MQPKNSFTLQSNPNRLGLLAVAAVVALVSLACNLLGTGDQIAMRNRLPTLTRTPLPTLTPTPAAIAIAAENTPTALPVAPPNTPTLPPAFTPVPTATPAARHSIATAAASPTAAPLPAQPQPQVEQATAPPPTPTATATAAPFVTATRGVPVATPQKASNPTPTKVSLPAPPPTPTPVPAPTTPPQTPGWSFAATRLEPAEDDSLLLYGEMINDTGSAQELLFITGLFYNDQGQLVADDQSTYDYWPVDVVPPGGRVPFELAVNDIQSAANFELWAKSRTSSSTPRQDFELVEENEQVEESVYCLTGSLKNPGEALKNYLAVVVIVYDEAGNVLNFGDDYAADVESVSGDTPLEFEVCLNLPGQSVSSHQVLAWGS